MLWCIPSLTSVSHLSMTVYINDGRHTRQRRGAYNVAVLGCWRFRNMIKEVTGSRRRNNKITAKNDWQNAHIDECQPLFEEPAGKKTIFCPMVKITLRTYISLQNILIIKYLKKMVTLVTYYSPFSYRPQGTLFTPQNFA